MNTNNEVILTVKSGKIKEIFQKIIDLSLQTDGYFYLIYQSNNNKTNFENKIVKKEVVLFQYINYNIKPTPGLIKLNLAKEQDRIILQQSIEQFYLEVAPQNTLFAKPRCVYGWIFSPLKIEMLVKDMGLTAIQKNNNTTELLRYYDPTVLSVLLRIFSDNQKNMLIRSLYFWLYINSDRQLIIEKNPRNISRHAFLNYSISEKQWRQIGWIESRNQTLARYHFFHPQYTLLESQADTIILQAFENAERRGYKNKNDLSEYAYYSLTIHPEFIDHDVISQVIKQNDNCPLIAQLKNITSSQWNKIKDDLNMNKIGKRNESV
ncbi:uncharacterized protein DUF4123 [Frischella perrara]|uniref:Uncharacterized protein n=1 Tax=Frischella perrara TaxID=1267021 RepID=A0A0A7RZW9_FRIPE|nr:DUF4123 domain-containing protein [Frischella perrara]AJA44850.1 protein of unknown function (DUF4123) [Frischella perrara]PWV57753.1 uncharacterized protein DUF4123 [Frischella perrara]